jgi:chitodextrinase
LKTGFAAMKNFPFWVVIFIIPLLAFLGEAASSHESTARVGEQGVLTDFIVQRLGAFSPEKDGGIQVDNIRGEAPLFVNLKAEACDNEKAPAHCQWNFGDGDVGLGGKTSHVFTTPGQYTIFLKIVDQQTGFAEYAQPIKVVAR